ncbi:MAG: PIG-L family deacetylase [Opitutaceae bacterium]
MNAAGILQELRCLQQVGTVLYVAAHPDDENTRLIAWLARGRGYRTGYLSLTRGDGGQNLIGPEIREALGVIRTQELLAARRIDGGEQFFTRANDFGYSKDSRETLQAWDREQVLSDMVRVIRAFRPDVIVTRFSPEPGGTHGHHTASAILAVEAFKLAADPKAFPEQLGKLEPWQAKRVLWNGFRRGGAARAEAGDGLRLDVGGFNALLGASYGEIAARSRTMHKSQGFGSVGSRGEAWEHFELLAGEPAAADIMDGVDAAWSRIQEAGTAGADIEAIIADFDPIDPSASVPALLALRNKLAALPGGSLAAHKQRQLDRILCSAFGLFVETTLRNAEAFPGQPLALEHSVMVRAKVPLTWKGVRLPATNETIAIGTVLAPNVAASHESSVTLPKDTPLSHPYWLREPGTPGAYRVDDPALLTRPWNPPAFPIEHIFEIEGQTLVVSDIPVQVIDDPVEGEIRHALEVVPPLTLAFTDELALFAPGEARAVTVEAAAARSGVAGVLKLQLPAGWTATPASHPLDLKTPRERVRFVFEVTAPALPDKGFLEAVAEVDGQRFSNRRIGISYDHLPPLLLQPPAQLDAVALDLQIRGRNIGYLPGAGDLVGECLARMGFLVTTLSGADLTEQGLKPFDAVVLGVRAFNTRPGLAARLPALFAYAEAGGTVVVQYNTTRELKSATLAPFPVRLSRDRVTDENAPVTFLAPGHPVLNVPNKITAADFEGWVQERGLYFPDQWDEHFTPILAIADPGEQPLEGSVLVAQTGEGWFVYTGLSWFRQLPAGVPGAYRLFANLVSLGN